MKVKVKMYNKKGLFHADGIYENGQLTILKGSTVKSPQPGLFRRAKEVISCRANEQIIQNNTLLKDVTFKSPSTAAQLVTDSSTNGYMSWKCEDGKNLKTYIQERKENK